MKKSLILLIITLMLAACAGNKESVIVEEFIGHNVQDVYAWCGKLDDNHECEISYAENDEYEKDIVYDQSIKAGGKFKDGTINFYVSNGITSEITMPHIAPEVTKSDIEVWKDAVGLITLNFVYEPNDEIEKNHVIRLEPVAHVKKDTPVTCYLSSGPSEPEKTSFEIVFGDYIGITPEEFEQKAKELGLNPNHQTSRDKYDSGVKIGNIVWHGSGVYEKGEVFNYGVCINAIVVNPGQFVGLSESDFIKAAKKLNLNPVHVNGRDSYSAKVDKGNVVTHGNGVYVEGEDFKYGISYGPIYVEQGYENRSESTFLDYLDQLTLKGNKKTAYNDRVAAGRVISYNYGKYSTGDYVTYYVSLGPADVYVDVPDFSGRSEAELLRFYSKNGILVGSRTEQSSLIPKGSVVSNDHGRMKAGDVADYVISTGPAKREEYIIESFSTVYDEVTAVGDYERAAWTMHRYLFGRGFTNYEIIPVAYKDYEPGILLSITIDGDKLGDYPVSVPYDTYIECRISNQLLQ